MKNIGILILLWALLIVSAASAQAKVNTGFTFNNEPRASLSISSDIYRKITDNQKFFEKERCDILVRSIKDSVEVCVYFYSRDTLMINGQKLGFKNRFKK